MSRAASPVMSRRMPTVTTAWPTSMPAPSKNRHPAARAARANAVSPWPYTTSNTVWSALRSAVSKGAGSPAFMPSGVASMMMSAPAMACRDVA